MEYAGKAGRPLDGLDVKSFFDGLVFFGPVALLVRTAAGVTVGQFFLLQAALACAALLSELPAGRLTDRIGYRNTLVLCEGLFLLARALLLTAFLCGSPALFGLEAVVEGVALGFDSGTRSAYLYATVPPEAFLARTAQVENRETAGFITSTVLYAGLYAWQGLTGLLAATVCTAGVAFLAACTLPAEKKSPAPSRPRSGRARIGQLLDRRSLALMAALAALSMGQLLVNFFYADKLAACGLRPAWMTPVILGYSALQMLAAPLLRRLPAAWRSRALGLCCGAAGAVMAALGLVRRAGPALALMLALPLLLQLPACLLEAGENAFIDARGLQDDRAWALSVFHMSSSALETAFLAGSSAVAAAGAAACFWAVGAALAGCGAWAARAIGREGLCIYSTENIE